ncbi:unnamed protein product [Paramecium sonneborni]|uniref:Uncharacterized protein n=1 Tax=Paramecium sonneborni TaxID=65129 RepID=A0A8S1REN2_9CILI|nr:unnamed protein product [Paramecium sonneborni]
MIDLPQRHNSNYMSKKSHPSCDIHLETELEYSPTKIRQKSINDIQLPLIQLDAYHRNFFDNSNINEYDCPTNKRYDRFRSFSTKANKNQKKGFLLLDINTQQISIIYKKLLTQLNGEFTKFQLTLYLTQYIGQLDYVNKLLTLLNFPSKITISSFKQLFYNIQEMQQIGINNVIQRFNHVYFKHSILIVKDLFHLQIYLKCLHQMEQFKKMWTSFIKIYQLKIIEKKNLKKYIYANLKRNLDLCLLL